MTELQYWRQEEPGESWVLKTDPSLKAYIQPGGCLEVYNINPLNDEQEFPHFHPEDREAVKEMIQYWEANFEV